jgi:hypothetical protein
MLTSLLFGLSVLSSVENIHFSPSHCASHYSAFFYPFPLSSKNSFAPSLFSVLGSDACLPGWGKIQCTPVVIMECSVCICLKSGLKGGILLAGTWWWTKKSKTFTKESAKKTKWSFIWQSTIRTATHKPSWWTKLHCKGLETPAPSHDHHTSAMFYRLGCINQQSNQPERTS